MSYTTTCVNYKLQNENITGYAELQDVTPEMDIHGYQGNIPDGLVLIQGVKVGRRDTDGSVGLLQQVGGLDEGDFVDVCFTINIHEERNKSIKVSFEPSSVVQLMTRDEFVSFYFILYFIGKGG